MSLTLNNNVLQPSNHEKMNGYHGNFFTKVTNPSSLISIVEKRLPVSCYILNQLKSYEKFTDELEIFMYGSGAERDTWILSKFYREDWDLMIFISAPEGVISEDVRQALLSSDLINWDNPFIFAALQTHVTDLILSININEFGNIIKIYPCYLFHMEKKDALQLDITTPTKVTVKSLEPVTGTPFITENWKYHNTKTYSFVRKSIERLPSGGVYMKGINDKEDELVCGAITPGFGLVSMLHTDPEHRRQGYASTCMKYIFQQLALEGFVPCLASEICNTTAVNFHRSMGLQNVARANFIGHKIDI
ncbi:unnamed protein product [Orchesella dallaii]|uniref:N-acetyltransferase domain-containing protein n=1 Tax=Orchesella dallaii TaxID=48710 RepID=A0ABP1RSE2_9HEXA